MNLKESYDYMFSKLSSLYTETHDNELGGVLGGLDTSLGGKPFDPASWPDWIEAIRKITSNEYITEEETKKAMIELLKEYNNQGFNLRKAIDYINKQIKA